MSVLHPVLALLIKLDISLTSITSIGNLNLLWVDVEVVPDQRGACIAHRASYRNVYRRWQMTLDQTPIVKVLYGSYLRDYHWFWGGWLLFFLDFAGS